MAAGLHDGASLLSLLADMIPKLFERNRQSPAAMDPDGRSAMELARELLTDRGEVAGFALSACLLDCYEGMEESDKRAFFTALNEEMDLDAEALAKAAEAYRADPAKDSYRDLMAKTEPARQELIRRLNRTPGATGRLVRMRADLMRLAKEDKALGRADVDFHHLFSSWFNRGFLVLMPITWESPASVLEKIIAYEAVHEIKSWDDLRRRLAPGDRRCFAFFHPSMPGEPLIFVEVALTKGIPGSISGLLKTERDEIPAQEADTAVFYSISNCQEGLAGISFGNLLIKQVAEDLGQELPHLKTYVTLSPIPGLSRWMEAEAEGEDLRALAAEYLLNARRPNGQPLDPVARFHLENGARVHDIHADADPSERGMKQSGGAMVNYLYDLDRITENHAAFAARGPVAASKQMRALAVAGAKLRDKREQE